MSNPEIMTLRRVRGDLKDFPFNRFSVKGDFLLCVENFVVRAS